MKAPMTKPNTELPAHIRKMLRDSLLDQLSNEGILGFFEIELFEFYISETEKVMTRMLEDESAYLQEQLIVENPDPNDSGMLAVDYHIRRVRYSNIIYLASLLETCLQRACTNLETIIGTEAIPFGLAELKGDQWSKRYRFLERYGCFELSKNLLTELETLTTIRNFLVHENGSTEKIQSNKRDELNRCNGINVRNHEIRIEEAYVRHALGLVKQLVGELESRLREVILRVKARQTSL